MDNHIKNDFCKAAEKMFDFCNGYTVVVWGSGISGQFINYVFRRNNKIVDYNVDKNHSIYTYRPYIIRSLDPKYTRVIVSFSPDEKVKTFLESYGFRQGVEYDEIGTWFGGKGQKVLGFENWLEYTYELDITSVPTAGTNKIGEESHNFHWGSHDYKFMEAFDSLLIKKDDAVFDYGCGKGGVLLLLKLLVGFNIIGGVEYDGVLYSAAVNNFEKMGLDIARLIHGDATELKHEIDDYNYFFLYDPFVGKQFEMVLDNIVNSYNRRSRKIIIIYASPQCDDIIQKNGKFILIKKIEANCMEYPGINIYTME